MSIIGVARSLDYSSYEMWPVTNRALHPDFLSMLRLGADPDASEMDLRQCFLRKAVEVHPATLRLVSACMPVTCKIGDP